MQTTMLPMRDASLAARAPVVSPAAAPPAPVPREFTTDSYRRALHGRKGTTR